MRHEGGLGALGGLFASVIAVNELIFTCVASENKTPRPPKPPLTHFVLSAQYIAGVGGGSKV